MTPTVEYARRMIVTLIKGAILVAWLVALTWGALLAIREEASRNILPTRDGPRNGLVYKTQNPKTPPEYLSAYVAEESIWSKEPALLSLLNTCVPGWNTSKENQSDFNMLFKSANAVLDTYLLESQFNPYTDNIDASFVTPTFQSLAVDGDRKADRVITAWIERQRQATERHLSQEQLANTFVLLTILGAFGSLIFLTRDYLLRTCFTRYADYIFRPILGILLAIGTFVLAITTNAVVSTSSILDVRKETLYVLALAAGLLADKAYALLDRKAAAALKRFEEDRETRGTAQPGVGSNLGTG